MADVQELRKGAFISECEQYRYWLTREWGEGGNLLAFVMLNPSTADASVDDPTIRRCVAFAKREGRTGIVVVNLFDGGAWRGDLPTISQEMWDRFIEIQTLRNAAISKATGEA